MNPDEIQEDRYYRAANPVPFKARGRMVVADRLILSIDGPLVNYEGIGEDGMYYGSAFREVFARWADREISESEYTRPEKDGATA